MTIYTHLLRPLFFRLDPERAHRVAMQALKLAGRAPFLLQLFSGMKTWHDPRLGVEAFGLFFRNPVGLAAGYDKNAVAVQELGALGFGHLELGTVTPLPQAGNPVPRIFRLPEDQAIINRMGFPNEGTEKILPRLKRLGQHKPGALLGVNLGKGWGTPLASAAADYSVLLQQYHPYVDFFVINVSSPNTPGLRQLQAKGALEALLGEVAQTWQSVCPSVPLLIKIAPDLSWAEVDAMLEVVLSSGLRGIVATNTTVSRGSLTSPRRVRDEGGGLSGLPLRQRATEVIRHIYRQTGGKLPIVGVGGVDSADAALEKILVGASLVQVYTGMIFQGPGLVQTINRGLTQQMERLGVDNLSALVGINA